MWKMSCLVLCVMSSRQEASDESMEFENNAPREYKIEFNLQASSVGDL